jgi:seryl-tRNA synthetase
MPKIKELLNRKEEYKDSLKRRGLEKISFKVEEGINKYLEWRKINFQLQKLREKINTLSREYNRTKKIGLIEESKKVKSEILSLEERTKKIEKEIIKIELLLPNWISNDVPTGFGEEYEKPINYALKPKVWKNHLAQFNKLYPGVEHEVIDFEPYHHYNLVGRFIDQEKAGKIATSRFYYLFDELALLDFAISMYAIEFFRKKGYANKLMITPYLMKKDVEDKITYFEAFEDTIFGIDKDNLILIPTSEHSIVAYYSNTIFDQNDLPLRILAWTPCFRMEAGAHGKDTKGIFRTKQFHKVEIHSILTKDEDLQEVYRMVKDVQDFLVSLELPNRAVIIPSGDMDKRALIQIDVETWFPAEGKYRETHSIGTLGTWVSEKLRIRYRLPNGKKELTRNVYATGVAVERLICALIENNYCPDTRTIKIPQPLQKYTLGINKIRINKNI